MGHIDVLGCKNINSVILKQICLNNLQKFILSNWHIMQPSPHKSHNNMRVSQSVGLSSSCILTKSTLPVIQLRSNIILRNPEWCPHLTFSGGRSVIWIAAVGHYKWCYYHWAITWTPIWYLWLQDQVQNLWLQDHPVQDTSHVEFVEQSEANTDLKTSQPS